MNSTIFSCLVLALSATACLSHDICLARQFQYTALMSSSQPHFFGLQTISENYYDEVKQMTVSKLSIFNSTFHPQLRNLIIRKGNVRYHYDYLFDYCWVKKNLPPFKKVCLPAHYKKIGNFSIGQKVGGLGVTSFRGSENGYTQVFDVKVDWTVMYPANYKFFDQDMNFIANLEFLNGVAHISDPSVFDLPDMCKDAEESDRTPFGYRDLQEFF